MVYFCFFSPFFFAVYPAQMCAHFNWNGKHECDSHLLLLQQTASHRGVCAVVCVLWCVCMCVCRCSWHRCSAAASAAYLIYTPIYTCSLLLLRARRKKKRKDKKKNAEKPHKPPTLGQRRISVYLLSNLWEKSISHKCVACGKINLPTKQCGNCLLMLCLQFVSA